MNQVTHNTTRRDFLKAGAAASTLAALGTQTKVFASNAGASDKLKVGLIGCGGRGTGALSQCVNAAPNIEVHALADFFPDKIEAAKKKFKKGWGSYQPIGDRLKVKPDHEFTGFNAYKKLLKKNNY